MKIKNLFAVLAILVLFASALFSQKRNLAILKPAKPGSKSEAIPINKLELKKIQNKANENNSQAFSAVNLGIIDTLRYSDTYDVNWGTLVGDTNICYFDPPAACYIKSIGIVGRIWDDDPIADGFELMIHKSAYLWNFPQDQWEGDGFYTKDVLGYPTLLGELMWGAFPVSIFEGERVWTEMIYLGFEPDSKGEPFIITMVPYGEAGAHLGSDATNLVGGDESYIAKYYQEGREGHNPQFVVRDRTLTWQVVVEFYENTPPTITLGGPYGTVVNNNAKTIECHITDVDAENANNAGVATVSLYYKVNDGSFSSVSSGLVSGTVTNGVWNATIPGGYMNSGDVLTFYFEATDKAGATAASDEASFSYFQKQNDILVFYNDVDTSYLHLALLPYYDSLWVDNNGNPYNYDLWVGQTELELASEIINMYDIMIQIDGYYPATLNDDVVGAWLAAGNKNLFWSSQDWAWALTENDGLDTTFAADDWHNKYMGIAGVGPQDFNYQDNYEYELPTPLNPVQNDLISGPLAEFVSDSLQLYYDPGLELGFYNWIDAITPSNGAVVCFTDSAQGRVCGVHKEIEGNKTVFLTFDQLCLNTRALPNYTATDGYHWTEPNVFSVADAALDWFYESIDLPQIDVSPDSFAFILPQGSNTTNQMTISNTGLGTLNYNIGWKNNSILKKANSASINGNLKNNFTTKNGMLSSNTNVIKNNVKLNTNILSDKALSIRKKSLQNNNDLLYEGFEAGVMPPDGWEKIDGSSTPGETAPAHWQISDTGEGYVGDFSAACPWGYDLNEMLITPSMNFSNVDSAKLSFWWISSYYWHVDPNDNGDLFVKVSVDGGNTWSALWGFGNIGVWDDWTWYESILDLSAFLGQSDVKIAFHVLASDNAYIYLDEISVTTSALAPSWISFNPTSGSISPNANQTIDLSVTTTIEGELLEIGNYYGNLIINSNDTQNRRIQIPVSLFVTGGCTPPYIKAEDVNGVAGDTVVVDITIKENPKEINAFGFKLIYPEHKLSFKRIEKDSLSYFFDFFQANENQPGKITIGGFDENSIPINSNGSIARLFFYVEQCIEGEISPIVIQNLADDLLGLNICDGLFTCKQTCKLGDVNMDEAISPGDALCAFQIYLNDGTPPDECDNECVLYSADLNCTPDGVTPADALYIFQGYLNGDLPPLQCNPEPAPPSKQNKNRLELDVVQVDNPLPNEITISIRLNNPVSIQAFGLNIGFPDDLMSFVRVNPSKLTENWQALDGRESLTGVISIGGFHNEAIPSNNPGDLAEITFKIKDDIKENVEIWLFNLVDDLSNTKVKNEKFTLITTGIRRLDSNETPKTYSLNQNYPNPFNMNTEIAYQLPKPVFVELEIYNSRGQKIRSLLSQNQAAGKYSVTWNGRDDSGAIISSGVYFYKLKTADFTKMKKLILIK